VPKSSEQEIHKSKIGGQALIEGVMMRGVRKTAMAVRLPDQTIDVEVWDTRGLTGVLGILSKIPFVRGIINMVDSLVTGYQCLMKSADKAGVDLDEEEPSKLDRWLEEKFGDNLVKVIGTIGAALGIILALVLFLFLPAAAVWGLDQLVSLGGWKGLVEGLIKILILVGYLWLVSRVKDMRWMYGYHGAEHKTIACFEAGQELTVENVRKQSRFHPRCGTSFLILVILVSILVSSFLTWNNPLIRAICKLLLLPVVVGVAYELIRLAGRYDNLLTKIISWPGTKLQYLTTEEPTDAQIEVAIAAFQPVVPENLEEDKW
jgi:uncharacterized protein YqhQ